MRSPPAVSLLFVAAAIAFLAAGIFQKYAGGPDDSTDEAAAEIAAPTPPHERRRQAVLAMSRQGDGQISYAVSFDPRNPYADQTGDSETLARSAFDPQDDYWGLPRTTGYQAVAGLCAACHSLEIVMQQRMTPERWAYTLNWMIEAQGMARPTDEEFDEILAYVTAHFSSETTSP